jgi:hypothetical protein
MSMWLWPLGVIAALAACNSVGPDAATITVQNKSLKRSVTVSTLACGATFWDSRGKVSAGSEKSWSVDPGCWDVQAKFSDQCIGLESRGRVFAANETVVYVVEDATRC